MTLGHSKNLFGTHPEHSIANSRPSDNFETQILDAVDVHEIWRIHKKTDMRLLYKSLIHKVCMNEMRKIYDFQILGREHRDHNRW